MAFQVLQSCLHVCCPDVTLGSDWSTESARPDSIAWLATSCLSLTLISQTSQFLTSCAPVCLQATVAATTCTIIADAANKDEIDARIKQIKKELSETDSVYDTEKLSERIAKLAGGVAVIMVRLLPEAIVLDLCC